MWYRNRLLARASILASAGLITGCTVGPNYHAPEMKVSDGFRGSGEPTTQPATSVDLTTWWQTFNDPALNSLVERAVKSNLDVRLAEARVLEARAQLDFQRGTYYPTLDGTGSYSRSRGSKNSFSGVPTNGGSANGGSSGSGGGTPSGASQSFSQTETDLFQAGFDASWEIDIFGGKRRAVEAAQATLEAQIEARRNAMVTLLAEVAQNYVELRGFQHQYAIVQRNLRSQQDTVALQRTKLDAGIATDLTVAQAEALLSSTQAQGPTLQTSIRQSIHRLSVLLDLEPTALQEELENESPLPTGPDSVLPGLPSELLRRRPDVRQAERQLQVASANIGVATAELFPKFSLNGSLGVSSAKFTNLAQSSSVFYSIGPSVSWRLFDAGQIQSNIRVENAVQEQAFVTYRQTVLQALSDVENTLTAYDRERARQAALQAAVASNRRALDLARQLNNAGVVDFLNVLTAQQSLYQAENELAQSDQTVSTNLVALYKALGGGWEESDLQRSKTN